MNNEANHTLNSDLIMRLTRYRRVLHKLKSLGFVKVFSNNLGDAIGVTPSLVRKDLSVINMQGNKRGGYQISDLIAALETVLGSNEPKKTVLVGCGRIGIAILEYMDDTQEGIEVLAGFDIHADSINNPTAIPIYDTSEMTRFIREQEVKIGIIAVPDPAAEDVKDQLLEAGIEGILNFAPVELKCSRNCIIHNINISLEIENLFYLVRMADVTEGCLDCGGNE
ncbi:MAG: redox-sensing transcriptional repressor Rex [Spirochaetales bacterium]|nr:redox-sensing transcriptional repressor Rex [Spirochaetales bacterium]MCF7939279.1 redox-sensing transcriptional repressor Rex [Spirochaetales bacterium]